MTPAVGGRHPVSTGEGPCLWRGRRCRALELAPRGGVRYTAAVDPSGGGADAFTLAILHAEDQGKDVHLVQDVMRGWATRRGSDGPNLEGVVREIATCCRPCGVTTIVGDRYAAGWVRERFRAGGLRYQDAEMRIPGDPSATRYLDKSLAYLEIEPLFAQARWNCSTTRSFSANSSFWNASPRAGGKTAVDHPPGDRLCRQGPAAPVGGGQRTTRDSRRGIGTLRAAGRVPDAGERGAGGRGTKGARWAGQVARALGSAGCYGYGCIGVLGLFVVGTVGGALVGGVSGAVSALPAETVKGAEAVLARSLCDVKLQEELRDRVVEVARQRARHVVVAVPDQGPSSPDEPTTYASAAGQGIDSILEISVSSIGLAGEWDIDSPSALAVDAAETIFVADTRHHQIGRVDMTTHTLVPVAGTGEGGTAGDGGPAALARLASPVGIAVDANGNLFIAAVDLVLSMALLPPARVAEGELRRERREGDGDEREGSEVVNHGDADDGHGVHLPRA